MFIEAFHRSTTLTNGINLLFNFNYIKAAYTSFFGDGIKGLQLRHCCKLNITHHGKLRPAPQQALLWLPQNTTSSSAAPACTAARLLVTDENMGLCLYMAALAAVHEPIKEYLVYCGTLCTVAVPQKALMHRNLSPFVRSHFFANFVQQLFFQLKFTTECTIHFYFKFRFRIKSQVVTLV